MIQAKDVKEMRFGKGTESSAVSLVLRTWILSW